jgi:hypothetical protein
MSGTDAAPAGWVNAAQRRQLAWITAGALGVFVALRLLPTGTSLSHMDFRVEARNAIEFCDPLNPQFIPVVAVKSPVTLSVNTAGPAVAGQEVRCIAVLRTAAGKAVASPDLLLAHTKKLHLLIADPTLTDYQHVHPQPGRTPGEWTFVFTPKWGGAYRVFADFTPAATGRGLYASADMRVEGKVGDVAKQQAAPADREGYHFELHPGALPMRANQPIDLTFAVQRADGGAVPLEPVMGAFAHLVAFDHGRTGFAHLHPAETDLTKRPDARKPELHFKVTIPAAGRYVVWAQVSLGGREMFVPFWFEVGS